MKFVKHYISNQINIISIFYIVIIIAAVFFKHG